MSFNIGLSALNAAQREMSVTGNNIANAGTSGFKSAKAVFGDVYAASVLGGGGTQSGNGVALQEIKQSFTQGNISFTDSTLDLAINGEGFLSRVVSPAFPTRVPAHLVPSDKVTSSTVKACVCRVLRRLKPVRPPVVVR